MERKQAKSALQLKRERIAKNLAKNEARAELFREELAQMGNLRAVRRDELKSSGIVNGSTSTDTPGGKHNQAPSDETV